MSALVAIDLFAGLGGLTEGAEQAGARVAVALNHWDFAVAVHELNHPRTTHLLQDARQAEWRDMPAFNLLMGGPACQGHSTAAVHRKHKKPEIAARVQVKHDVDRATAWAMVECAEVCHPEWLIAENVEAWLRWPLFDLWREALHRLGLHTHVLVLAAVNYGIPQARKRVFVVGARSATKLVEVVCLVEAQAGQGLPLGAGSIVRWDQGRWKPAEQCGPGSRVRILAGLDLGVDRWWCQHVTGHRGKPMSAPFSTITGQDQHVVCRRVGRGVEYRNLLPVELLAAQDFPETYRLPAQYTRRDLTRAVGNAVPPRLGRVIVSAIRQVA